MTCLKYKQGKLVSRVSNVNLKLDQNVNITHNMITKSTFIPTPNTRSGG